MCRCNLAWKVIDLVPDSVFCRHLAQMKMPVRRSSCLPLQVAGTSGKVHIDGDSDDEGASSEAHGSAIIEALGWDRRNEVWLTSSHEATLPRLLLSSSTAGTQQLCSMQDEAPPGTQCGHVP